jgi:AcrR family transcriptional regulator
VGREYGSRRWTGTVEKEQAFNRTKKRRTRSGRRRKVDTTTKGTRTKYRLAEAMKECMKTTPVDNITVTQLTELCGVTRQTFYRNFIDKYDLINWYFDILLHKSFEHMGSGKNIYESLVKKFIYIREERVFFSAGFKSADQNNLKDHDFRLILVFYEDLIRQKTGKMPDEEIGFLLEMYCQSSVYMTVKWVTEGTKMPPERLAELMVKAMPEKISELFEQLEILY